MFNIIYFINIGHGYLFVFLGIEITVMSIIFSKTFGKKRRKLMGLHDFGDLNGLTGFEIMMIKM